MHAIQNKKREASRNFFFRYSVVPNNTYTTNIKAIARLEELNKTNRGKKNKEKKSCVAVLVGISKSDGTIRHLT
jgi:hypothetical protein